MGSNKPLIETIPREEPKTPAQIDNEHLAILTGDFTGEQHGELHMLIRDVNGALLTHNEYKQQHPIGRLPLLKAAQVKFRLAGWRTAIAENDRAATLTISRA